MDEWDKIAEGLLPKSHWADDDVRIYVDDRRSYVAVALRVAYNQGASDMLTRLISDCKPDKIKTGNSDG